MKKSAVVFLLAFALVALLISCAQREDTNTDNTPSGDIAQTDEYIYSENSSLTLIYDESTVEDDNYALISNTLFGVVSGKFQVGGTDLPKSDHEIVLGKTERDISVAAYKYLDRINTELESEQRYLVYSDGTSVAIAYDDSYFGISAAESVVIKHFVDNFLADSELKLKKGIIHSGVIEAIAWQEAIDAVETEAQWQRIEASFAERTSPERAKEILTALRNMYADYNDDVVSWIANLYDPAVGGFYYSNSARNTEGFLPDLESTYQLLGLPVSLGMTDGKDVSEFYPKEMADAIVKWVKGLQDAESGYFYHPQWGKAFTDKIPNRRGRDLQWAERLLAYFGAKPTYDTPGGVKGDGILADGSPVAPASARLTEKLNSSIASAVSKLILVSDEDANVTAHLRSEKAFRDYLAGLDINGNSYSVGNLLESQATQIVARDRVLASRGETYRLADILHKWMNEHQNPETGLWTLDGSVNYSSVNGLLKIGATYNKIGKEIPNIIPALGSAIACLISEAEPVHICDVLNPLYAISEIKNNINKYCSGDRATVQSQLENASKRILDDAVKIVEVTHAKVSLFRKQDGSYSYYPTQTAASSQGATVALVNTNEGDANTANIALAAIPAHLFSALGISDKPEFCTKADGVRYLSILADLGAVIKDKPDDERDTAKGKYVKEYGGEFYPDTFVVQQLVDIYRASSYIACNDEEMTNTEQERIRLLEDELRLTGVLEYGKSTSPSTHGFVVRRTGAQNGGNCFVFETEIKLNSLDPDSMASILDQKQPILLNFTAGVFESATAAKVASCNYVGALGAVYLEKQNGKYYSSFSHATKPYQYISYGTNPYNGKKIEADDWFTVTVELYDNGIAKYYINNKYFEEAKVFDDTSAFFNDLDSVKINLGYYATNSSVWIDNTFVGTVQKEYVEGDAMRNYDYIGPGNYGVSYGGLDFNVDNAHVLQQSGYITRATWNTITGTEGLSYSDTSFHREFMRISEVVRNEKIDKVFEFGARTTNAKGIYLRETNPKTGDTFVFETEILLDIDETTAEKVCKLGAAPIFYFNFGKSIQAASVPATDPNYCGSELARIYANKDSSGNIRYYFNAPVGRAYMACTSAAEITSGWHTITMEIFSNGQVKYYVDGNLLGDAKILSSQDISQYMDMNSVKISINDGLDNSYFFFDNTYVTRMDIPYVSSAPDSGSDDEGGGEDGSTDIDSPFDDVVDDNGWG